MVGEDERKAGTLRGCIKKTKGPWLVHRTTKDGRIQSRYRFPSENERQKNKLRERRRRAVAQKIFAGLKEHGNYNLPKHADSNDLLKALCEEAGWHVDEDGTIYRKNMLLQKPAGSTMAGSIEMYSSCQVTEDDHDYCTCSTQESIPASRAFLSTGQSHHEYNDMNLMLSLSASNSCL